MKRQNIFILLGVFILLFSNGGYVLSIYFELVIGFFLLNYGIFLLFSKTNVRIVVLLISALYIFYRFSNESALKDVVFFDTSSDVSAFVKNDNRLVISIKNTEKIHIKNVSIDSENLLLNKDLLLMRCILDSNFNYVTCSENENFFKTMSGGYGDGSRYNICYTYIEDISDVKSDSLSVKIEGENPKTYRIRVKP